MSSFTLRSLADVEAAISAVSAIQGAYQSVGLLAQALKEVEESQDFVAEVRQAEQKQGYSYEGPEDASRLVIKAIRTAANASGVQQDKLLELVSLVVVRLGVSQGTRVLSVLLLSCGINPTLTIVVLKLCVILSRTEMGQRIVAGAQPCLKEAVAAVSDKTQLVQPIQQLAASMGEKGEWLVSAVTGTPREPLDELSRPVAMRSNVCCPKKDSRRHDNACLAHRPSTLKHGRLTQRTRVKNRKPRVKKGASGLLNLDTSQSQA